MDTHKLHSSLPWFQSGNALFHMQHGEARLIEIFEHSSQAHEDVAFIVHACNLHDEMLDALKNWRAAEILGDHFEDQKAREKRDLLLSKIAAHLSK